MKLDGSQVNFVTDFPEEATLLMPSAKKKPGSVFVIRSCFRGPQSNQVIVMLKAQFYIQLLYRPHLGTCILPFGLLGSKKKISETTEFLLKYATFLGGFFMFSWAKK